MAGQVTATQLLRNQSSNHPHHFPTRLQPVCILLEMLRITPLAHPVNRRPHPATVPTPPLTITTPTIVRTPQLSMRLMVHLRHLVPCHPARIERTTMICEITG